MPKKIKVRELPQKVKEIANGNNKRKSQKIKDSDGYGDEFDKNELDEFETGPQFSGRAFSSSARASPVLESGQGRAQMQAQDTETQSQAREGVSGTVAGAETRVLYTSQGNRRNGLYETQTVPREREAVYVPLENQTTGQRKPQLESPPPRPPVLTPERMRPNIGFERDFDEQDRNSLETAPRQSLMAREDQDRYYEPEAQKPGNLMARRRKDWRV